MPYVVLLECQPAFAGCFGKRLDAAMVKIRAAVEYDCLDPLFISALGDQLADLCGGFLVCSGGDGLFPADAAATVLPLRSSIT